MEHQHDIAQWIPRLEEWEERIPFFEYIEMPVMPRFDFTSRASIFLSMRWFIPEKRRRRRTYPIYTEMRDFLMATNTPSQVQARAMLVDNRGQIHINAPGSPSENIIELFERRMGTETREIWQRQ